MPVQAWEDIAPLIRGLDRNRYPFLFLWPTTDEGYHEISDDEVFQVMGGRGAYWVAVTLDRFDNRRLDVAEQGEEEVWVWESDQGYGDSARHVCFDAGLVLQVARYYAEHGGVDTHLIWKRAEAAPIAWATPACASHRSTPRRRQLPAPAHKSLHPRA